MARGQKHVSKTVIKIRVIAGRAACNYRNENLGRRRQVWRAIEQRALQEHDGEQRDCDGSGGGDGASVCVVRVKPDPLREKSAACCEPEGGDDVFGSDTIETEAAARENTEEHDDHEEVEDDVGDAAVGGAGGVLEDDEAEDVGHSEEEEDDADVELGVGVGEVL